jgi:UDP-N-acetylglucosamine:LPS N-acetylglucosamine transferase
VFIGPLSRFTGDRESRERSAESDHSIDLNHSGDTDLSVPPAELVILISGPEPQRTKLENIILEQMAGFPKHTVILQGNPGEVTRQEAGPHSTMYSHLPSDKVRTLLVNTPYIICRGGYTTIMDLITVGRTAMIIPTPGQTEQEYLSSYLSGKGFFPAMDQKNLDLLDAIRQLDGFQTCMEPPDSKLLDEELDQWF